MGARVVGRRARHVARRRRAGQAAGQRADRLGGVQHARLEPREERAQRARQPGHAVRLRHLLDTSRERGVTGSSRTPVRCGGWRTGRGDRCTGCGRSPGIQPTRAAGWRPSGAPSSGIGGPGTAASGRGDRHGGRADPPGGAAAAVQRGVDDLRRRARMGGAAVLPALPAPGRPLRRRGRQRRRLLDARRHADPGRAHHGGGAVPAGARGPARQPRAERAVESTWWTPPLSDAAGEATFEVLDRDVLNRLAPDDGVAAMATTGHHGARHHARRAGGWRSAGADQDRRRGLGAARHEGGAPAAHRCGDCARCCSSSTPATARTSGSRRPRCGRS